jgi:hypothetical protein
VAKVLILKSPRASKNLRKHGDSQEVQQWALFALSLAFWLWAVLSDRQVMSAQVYGEWVTQVHAEIWAASIMVASVLYLLGIYINGNWRWSPILRVVGASWHIITMGLFVAGAAYSSDGHFIVLTSGTFCGLHVVFLSWNISDLYGALFHWRKK